MLGFFILLVMILDILVFKMGILGIGFLIGIFLFIIYFGFYFIVINSVLLEISFVWIIKGNICVRRVEFLVIFLGKVINILVGFFFF